MDERKDRDLPLGLRPISLSGSAYRSPDDSGDDQVSSETVRPAHVIETLKELPSLLERLLEKNA
jgi:hypothetical protein